MKRFHVHLGVPNLAASIRFYSQMFGTPPAVEKPDYAKWMLDDPRLNFAISTRSGHSGLNHLGLQADSAEELATIRDQFTAADAKATVDEPDAHCCYARGDKHWTQDPQGIAWEAFHTLESIPVFGASDTADAPIASACCAGTAQGSPVAMPATPRSCCA
ncbi:MAG: VOC family protein [Proteobacteria bacterium]|nr:VOC family protein [Pseudomonadota bacterium]